MTPIFCKPTQKVQMGRSRHGSSVVDYRQGMVTRNISTTAIQNFQASLRCKMATANYRFRKSKHLAQPPGAGTGNLHSMMLAGLGMVGVALRKRAP